MLETASEARVTPSSASALERAEWPSWMPAFITAIAAAALHFCRFGYSYASGDQDETLALVLHSLNPTLYGGDWFIQTQSGEMGVRSAFVWLLSGLGEFLPLWITVALVHMLVIVFVAMAVYRLVGMLTSSETTAAITTIVSLVLTPQWTLGANDLVHSILAPSSVAWCLALWGLVFHLEDRRVSTGVLLGAATLFQALVGLQVAAVVFAHLLVRPDQSLGVRLRSLLLTAAPAGLLASMLLVPLFLERLQSSLPEEPVYPSLFYLLAAFRAPHHYLPLSFPAATFVKFGLLLVAGMSGLMWLRRKHSLRHADFLFVGLNMLAIFLVLGFLFTEIVPVLEVASFQPFKITVLAKPILIAGIVGAVVHTRPVCRLVNRVLERVIAWRPAMIWTMAIALLVVAAGLGIFIRDGLRPIAHARSDLGAVERWAASSTNVGATFLVPPSNTTFRVNAQRGIVINFKSIPFEPDLSLQWFQRLLAIAPIELPDRATAETLSDLDNAYSMQSPHRLSALASQFGATYILIERDIEAPDLLREVYVAGNWHVYQATSAAGPHLARIAHSPRG